jgi:hypothetical protein
MSGRDCFSCDICKFLIGLGGSLAGGIGLATAKKLSFEGLIAGVPRLMLFLVKISRCMMFWLTFTILGEAVAKVLRLTTVTPLLTYTFL